MISAEGVFQHWDEAQGCGHDAKASKTVHRQVLARSGGPHCEGSSGCKCGIDALCPGFSPFVINPVSHEQDLVVCVPFLQVVALLVFIMGCAMANDLGARLFDVAFGNGSRQALGGWTAFLAFLITVVQVVMIILRFLNFAATFWYPLLVLLLVSAGLHVCVWLCVREGVLQGINCD